jgi:hypothetical protein
MERIPRRRRVVTRSHYFHIMSRRYALLSMTGVLLSLGMLGIVGSALGFLTLALTGSDILDAGEWLLPLCAMGGFSQVMYALGRVSVRQMKRWEPIVPLTNEAALTLPLRETLLRPPPKHDEAEQLLLPAPPHSEISPEQLLRQR